MTDINTPLIKIHGIGDIVAKKLSRLNIFTFGDLIFHFPRRWDDFSHPIAISKVKIGENNIIRATIEKIAAAQTPRGKMLIIKATVSDGSGTLNLVWFNRPFLVQTLKTGDEWIFSGTVDYGYKNKIIMNAPVFEKEAAIHPIYPETKGLNSKYLRKVLKSIILNEKNHITDDFLPLEIIKKYNLLELNSALEKIHFPGSRDDIEQAQKRLAFDELFLLGLRLQLSRKNARALKSYSFKFDKEIIREFTESLPFELTDDQKKSARAILLDLLKEKPMNRILQGEVGSGKTIVALIACIAVANNQGQTAWLAPTEILARQHYENIAKTIKEKLDIKIGLITGSEARIFLSGKDAKIDKNNFKKTISRGEIDIVIGTHALIQKGVEFKKLGLVIVDEQHRFGVKQRAALCKNDREKKIPHFLSMTATPIPRTLTLSLYGDLDISSIRELPKQRKKIITKIVPPTKRKLAYNFIENQTKQERQVFVICPLVEPKDITKTKEALFIFDERKAAIEEYKKLSEKIFPKLKIGLLHGKMKSKEKEETMKKFCDRKLDILVTTSVVEVGIDVPNASVMMIEGAERFGLAQLHQFRGRVGRGPHQSYCFLFTSSGDPFKNRRLKALVESNDGFKLAEKDLLIRGPGELAGQRQSGLPDLKMASLIDTILLEKTNKAAKEIADQGIDNFPLLKERMKKYDQERHLE